MTRDTDADWQQIALTHPYYGVMTDERYLQPDAEDLKEFFASGERDIAYTESVLRRLFGQFAPTTALDFGCGVGRLLIPMAKRMGNCYGVDVADQMLGLAKQHSLEAGVNVELGKEVPAGRRFDWVNSTVVLQHIPPARGYGIIRALWDVVAPDGCLSLHLTIYKDFGHFGELQRDLKVFAYDGEEVLNYTFEQDSAAGMSMYDYNLSRVLSCFDLPDSTPVYMETVIHGACHGIRIYLRKRAPVGLSAGGRYDAREFVEQLYEVVLGRPADLNGLMAWINFLDRGGRPGEILSAFVGSEENQRRLALSHARNWIGYGAPDIAFLESWRRTDLIPTPGFVTDFIGSKTRISSLWRGCEFLDGTIHPLPVPSDFHADATEWLGTLKAVAAATGSLSVMELGAGIGPWLVAAGVAAANRGIDDLYLCGVEGDPGRFALLKQHLIDNHLEQVPQLILNAAVGVEDGVARWPVLTDPANQAGARPMRNGEADDHAYLGAYLDLDVTIEVRVLSFAGLLAKRPLWDLIHIDVQGTEVELCRACLDDLRARARYLVVGTHSRKLDGDLIDLLFKDGWILEHERPCSMKYRTGVADLIHCSVEDGTQVWRNPRL